MSPVNFDGKLIVVEGGDGIGKSTQVELLKNRLSSSGRTVVEFDFPNKAGSPIADLISEFLRGSYGDVVPEFVGLAFAADRLAWRSEITARIRAGAVVLCDRYVLSNIAFQTAKLDDEERRRRLERLLLWLEYDLYQLPAPDLELVLVASEIHYSEGRHLARDPNSKRGYLLGEADIHESSLGLQSTVNRFFARLDDGPRLHKIDVYGPSHCRLSVNELHSAVWSRVRECL